MSNKSCPLNIIYKKNMGFFFKPMDRIILRDVSYKEEMYDNYLYF